MAPENTTQRIQGALQRLGGGELQARADLLTFAAERLRALARHMFKAYPRLRRFEEPDDVLHNAQVRLIRALEVVPLDSVQGFFRLASLQIRRELLNLTRYHLETGRRAMWADGDREPGFAGDDQPEAGPFPETTFEPVRLAQWTEFHEQVQNLPEPEREVFDLLWYQELSEAEAAELLQVSVRTVQRRWRSARLRLHQTLRG